MTYISSFGITCENCGRTVFNYHKTEPDKRILCEPCFTGENMAKDLLQSINRKLKELLEKENEVKEKEIWKHHTGIRSITLDEDGDFIFEVSGRRGVLLRENVKLMVDVLTKELEKPEPERCPFCGDKILTKEVDVNLTTDRKNKVIGWQAFCRRNISCGYHAPVSYTKSGAIFSHNKIYHAVKRNER